MGKTLTFLEKHDNLYKICHNSFLDPLISESEFNLIILYRQLAPHCPQCRVIWWAASYCLFSTPQLIIADVRRDVLRHVWASDKDRKEVKAAQVLIRCQIVGQIIATQRMPKHSQSTMEWETDHRSITCVLCIIMVFTCSVYTVIKPPFRVFFKSPDDLVFMMFVYPNERSSTCCLTVNGRERRRLCFQPCKLFIL